MSKKNLLVIESTDSHAPYIETLMELFSHNDAILPYAFFNKKNENILKNDFTKFYNKNNDAFVIDRNYNEETNHSFYSKTFYRIRQLKQIIETIKNKKIDFICVNTIQTNKNILLALYLILSNKKFALTIHDTQFNKKKISDKVFSFLQKKTIKKSSFLFFLGDYLKEDKIFQNKKKIQINYVYNFSQKKIKKYNKTTFAILGTPNNKKGDFDKIFQAFHDLILLNEDNISKKIKLIIPVKIRSKQIIKLIHKYKLTSITDYFEKYVPEEEYLRMLEKSHYSIIPELFDKSSGDHKISASFSYACAYNLPIIVHSSYLKNDKSKKDYVYDFDSKNSFSKILKTLTSKEYKSSETEKQFERYNKIYCFDYINNAINSLSF